MSPTDDEPSIEVIVKMGVQWGWGDRVGFFFWFFFFLGGGCQGGCEREQRIEVIVKIKKKNWGEGVRSGWI